MEEIVQIPRLARGSFTPDSGVGCIMNLMCWTKKVPAEDVNDTPDGYYEPIQDTLIGLNDTMCVDHGIYELGLDHGLFSTTNCTECSRRLLDWAFALDETDFLEPGNSKVNSAEKRKVKRLLDVVQNTQASINAMKLNSTLWYSPETFEADLKKLRRGDAMRSLAMEYPDKFCTENVSIDQLYNGWYQMVDAMVKSKLYFLGESYRCEYEGLVSDLDDAMTSLISYVSHLRRKYVPQKRITPEDFKTSLDQTFFDYGIEVPSAEKEKV